MNLSPLPLDTPPLVGRDREVAILGRTLDAALAGRGSLVLISGEAGIGKTALAEALCRNAARQGALVLVGHCYDLSETPPYGPWLESFGSYQRTNGSPSLPSVFTERRIVDDVASQWVLFDQVSRFVQALAANRPLILVLEDLHWADHASLDLLRFLARSASALPVLILATYRSDELNRRHPLHRLLPLFVREARAERLDLHPLSDTAMRALANDHYALDGTNAARLVTYLRQRGEGNALFIGELLRSLEETNALRREGERWVVGDLDAMTIPPLLRQVIDARVDRLDAGSQRLLAVAAIIGQAVPLDVWRAVAAVDEGAVLNAVAEAQGAHILAETADGRGAVFIHALIREALYQGTRPMQRRQLHGTVGALLADGPNAEPDIVAYHFQQADDVRAISWLVQAGERAEVSFAWLTAVERYEAAIAALAKDGTDPDVQAILLVRMAWLRRWSRPADSLAALDMAWHLADRIGERAIAAASRLVRGIQRCRMGILVDGLVDIEVAAAAIDGMPADALAQLDRLRLSGMPFDHASMWGSLILRLGSSGRTERALALGLPLVAGMPPSAPLTDVHFGLAYAQSVSGEFAAARASFVAARFGCHAQENPAGVAETALYELECALLPHAADALGERRALADTANAAWVRASGAIPADVPVLIAHLPLLVIEGRWDEAWELGLALRKADQYTSRRYLANRTLGPLAFRRGERSVAWEAIADTLPRGPETPPGEARFFDATILQRLAIALALDAGDPATALAWLEAHDGWLAWSGATLGKSEGQLLRAQYHRAIDDTGRASVHADQALAHANAPRQPLALIAAHRLVGELQAEAKQSTDAATHLDVSLRLADACAAPFERALTLLAHAHLQAAAGKPDGARTLVDEVRAICAPLGARPTLDRADALGRRLAAMDMDDAPPAYPAGLSAREAEILRLVAAGHTNRQIADMLFLSERTVHVHVRNIFAKTRTDNRAGATAFAFRNNIA